MEARYMRNLPALTEAECGLLQTKKAAVIGCGGLGGYLIELLARVGLGSLVVVDADVLEESNLNRQLLAQVPLLGTAKAEAAKARVAAVNPHVSVTAIHAALCEENAPALLAGCDVVLDGLDSACARRMLADSCRRLELPLIHGAINGWLAQAAVILPGDEVMERLYPQAAEPCGGSALSFTAALCASLQAALCVRLLVGRPVRNGVLYCCDLLGEELETIPVGGSRPAEKKN